MSGKFCSSLICQDQMEFKKVEAIKALAHLIKKYAGELTNEKNSESP